MARALQIGIGLAITSAFLWVILRQVSLAEIGAAMARADEDLLFVAVLLFLAGYACRVQRWRLMLLHENPQVSWARTAVPFLGSIAVNNLVPLRAGDALRAFGFTGWLGVPASAVVATVLVERLLDLLTLMIALGLVMALLPAGAELSVILGLGTGGLALAVTVTALVLLFPRRFQPVADLLLRRLARAFPRIGAKLLAAVSRVFDTLNHLAGRATMPQLLLWSVLAWSFEASVFYSVALAMRDIADPLAGLVAMPVGTLSTLLPSSPGYVGTFHFFVGKTVELLGPPLAIGAAFAVTVHLVLWLTATLTGGACLLAWGLLRGRKAVPLEKGT